MKKAFAFLFLCFASLGVLKADEQPPYEVKDPSISENFRNSYYALDSFMSSATTNAGTFLQTSSATATYLQLSSATANFIRNMVPLQSGAVFNVSSASVAEFFVSTWTAYSRGYLGTGTLALPALAFNSDANSGLRYVVGSGPRMVVSQIDVMNFTAALISVNVPFSVPYSSFTLTGYSDTSLYVSSAVTTNTPVATSDVYFDGASISVASGTWYITARARYQGLGATFTSVFIGVGVSTTSGNSSSNLIDPINEEVATDISVTANVLGTMNVINYRVTPTVTTTYYLKGYAGTFTVGNPRYICFIEAIKSSW